MISHENHHYHWFWLSLEIQTLKKIWFVRYIYNWGLPSILYLHDIFLNLNQVYSMTYTGYIFIIALTFKSAMVWAEVYWGYLHTSEKPKVFCIKLKFFETACHYICLWAAFFCGQICIIHFKLMYSPIWRNSSQPKHLINSVLVWPCLRSASCRANIVTKWRQVYLHTRPGHCPFPSGHDNIQPYFIIFSCSIVLHSIWR